MKHLIVLLAVIQPLSIHYSDVGNYLVDQDGKRTTIHGHPNMTCYTEDGEVHGKFQKARGRTIWLIDGSDYIQLKYPVCDLKK